jgi:MOSC domain-containing protein YiiM
MAEARVLSVNAGAERKLPGNGTAGRSAIDKRPVAGPAAVGVLGLDGDEQADQENHGGRDQALYAYAREDLDWWVERLRRELPDGRFGENITTAGLDITGAMIGEVWQLGPVTVQITGPRIPCVTFRAWLGEDHWVRRFAAAGRPGAYLRVLAPGRLCAGDPIRRTDCPARSITVGEAMRAYYGDQELMRRLLEVPERSEKWDEVAQRVLGSAR